MNRHVSLSKTTRPTPPGVIARQRLFTLLDRRRRAPVVWVSGPPGSGKTTLVSSYLEERNISSFWYQLDKDDSDIATFFYYMAMASDGREGRNARPLFTREYHEDLAAFCRGFFSTLYAELEAPFVVVLDNYHEISPQSQFHEVLSHAVAEMPPEGCMVVTSRSDPPASMVKLRASRQLGLMGWSDLQLKRRESDAIASRWHPDLSRAVLKQLYEKTEGWAAGLVLLLDQAENEGFLERMPSLSKPQLVFDYLAGEVFENFDEDTQQFLLRSAFLPETTVATAMEIAAQPAAKTILDRLHKDHYFVALKSGPGESVYMYHPLLRAFLQVRATERMSADACRELRRKAAVLLEADDAVDLAAGVLREGDDFEAFLPLVLDHAADMLKRGRAETLEGWLDEVPEDLADEDPWFHYWRGACLFLQSSLRESRHAYRRAFALFESREPEDLRGLLMTCSGLMDAILHELDDLSLLDRWIDTVDTILERTDEIPWPEVRARVTVSMFMALVLRQPYRDDLSQWAEQAFAETENIPDIIERLSAKLLVAINLNYTGQFARARDLVEHLRKLCASPQVPPIAHTVLKDVESMYFSLNADHEHCLEAVYDGIEIGRQSGVHNWSYHLLSNGVASALGAGDLETAETLLGEMQTYAETARRLDLCIYHYYTAWHAMLCDDGLRAHHEQKIALRLATETGCPFYEILCRLGLALVFAESGDERRAASQLRKVHASARNIDNRLLEFMSLSTYAYIALEHGRERSGLSALRYAMDLGREHGFKHFLWWVPKVMARLCEHALKFGIETEYVCDLVKARGLVPETPPVLVKEWPWRYRIVSFGEFGILKDNKPLGVFARVQQKPLQLLKGIVGLGGENVSESALAEALWPRIDADYAHRSLTTNLHRLRKLLGEDAVVLLRHGRLSLNPELCWLDLRAFDAVSRQVESFTRQPKGPVDIDAVGEQIDAMLAVYCGPFMADETDNPVYISLRERLRNRFLRCIGDLGRLLETSEVWEQAADLYQRSIEVDQLAEGLYRRLMVCFRELGRQSEGVEVYDACKRTFRAELEAEPSPETTVIYQNLLRDL